ncbi:hypothetical protein N0V90_011355 [Kalmusia sp. IMI 367209]|nr:hypothetical protein N0V90_011355 [Kalmusia sp. IMI 367209]
MAEDRTTSVAETRTNHAVYAHFIAKEFLSDPVFAYMLLNAPWYARPHATYHIIRLQLLAANHKSRAIYYSTCAPAGAASQSRTQAQIELDPHCAAVVMPPGCDFLDIGARGWAKVVAKGGWKLVSILGLSGWKRFADEYVAPVDAAKASVFRKDETYYYVLFIATGSQHRGKGLAQVVLENLKERAQKEMKPIWLEASSPASRRVYKKCGFVDVGRR